MQRTCGKEDGEHEQDLHFCTVQTGDIQMELGRVFSDKQKRYEHYMQAE